MAQTWPRALDAHRHDLREGVLDAVGALVEEHGVTGLTMSRLAARAGIGRATLYRHFDHIDDVLAAWHERHVGRHLEHLTAAAPEHGDALDRLHGTLTAYAMVAHHQAGSETAAALHRTPHAAQARDRLVSFVGELVTEGVAQGRLREDLPAGELAAFALHALEAARSARSKAAVHRLVALVLQALSVR